MYSYSNSDPTSTSGGLSVVGILPISGASSIKLSKTGGDNNATTATAYTANGATKSLTFGAYQDISGYDYIRFSASFSMSFPRDATVTLDDIT